MRHPERIHLLRIAVFYITLIASTGGSAVAAEIEEVQFVDAYRLGDITLRLNNVGLMRHKGFIKAMVAGLYIQDGAKPDRVLSDVSKRLEIEYFWSLSAEHIVKASEKLLSDNVDKLTLQRLRPQLDRMHALYENVGPGDRYALTYSPGHGTSLSLNGDVKGTIPGAEFAASYFSIWLGKQPMNVSLKRQLLSTRR